MPKKTILVAEDDSAILEVMTIILEENDYEVVTTTDTATIQKIVKEKKPNLILLDIWMSGQDGRDIAKFLKKNPETKSIPIIMISAHNATAQIAKEAGANDYLTKPFDINDLLSLVKKYIK